MDLHPQRWQQLERRTLLFVLLVVFATMFVLALTILQTSLSAEQIERPSSALPEEGKVGLQVPSRATVPDFDHLHQPLPLSNVKEGTVKLTKKPKENSHFFDPLPFKPLSEQTDLCPKTGRAPLSFVQETLEGVEVAWSHPKTTTAGNLFSLTLQFVWRLLLLLLV